MRGAAADVLLALGLVVVVLSCLASAVLPDPTDRLHVITPASTLGVGAICASVVVHEGLDASGTAALLLGVVVAGTSPLLSHACARAFEVRRQAGADLGDRPPPS